eukprot:1068169-Rhodomonas_salina.1
MCLGQGSRLVSLSGVVFFRVVWCCSAASLPVARNRSKVEHVTGTTATCGCVAAARTVTQESQVPPWGYYQSWLSKPD